MKSNNNGGDKTRKINTKEMLVGDEYTSFFNFLKQKC